MTKKEKKELEIKNKNRAYRVKWNKENCKQLTIKLNNEKDKDVIKYLVNQPNRTNYIRSLVKEDMAKNMM